MNIRSNRQRDRRPAGFTLLEMTLVAGLTGLLLLLVSESWAAFGRPSVDAVIRTRVIQEADHAVASLSRDLDGGLDDVVTGKLPLGQLVGRLVPTSSQLMLCYDGGTPDGLASWTSPDTVIAYDLQSGQLVRTDQSTSTSVIIADNVQSLAFALLTDGVQIDLTITYRDLTRDFTIVAKNP